MRHRLAHARGLVGAFALLVLAAVAVTGGAVAASGAKGPLTEKVILFASDGMRPDLVDKYAAQGAMPTMAQLLAEGGLEAKVVDFSFFPFGPIFLQNKGQIDRVEQLSDAYHLRFADEDVMVAYLLEVTRSSFNREEGAMHDSDRSA